MQITDYMTYQEVRTVCGLSSDELSDTELAAPIYVNSLSLAMASVELPDEEPGPGPLKTRFDAIKLIEEASRTAAQQKLYDLARIYFVYAVARETCMSLAAKMPKSVSDGKVSITRFSPESVYRDVVQALSDRLNSLKTSIERINESTSFVQSFMKVASPSIDVVTDE